MVAKRSASPGPNERPSKRQMTSSPEEGELDETEVGDLNNGFSLTKSPPGPPPTDSVSTNAPPKFKVAFPFKKKPASLHEASSLQPVPARRPARSPSRSPPDSPPPKQHRLPPPREDYRRGISPPVRKRGFDRYIPDDYSYDSRRGYDRRDRERHSYYPSNEPSGRYDSYRPGYSDGRRPRSRSRSRTGSQSRSRSRRSRSPHRRGHPRSPSPRTTHSPARTNYSRRSTTPATHHPPPAVPNFSPPSRPRTHGFSPTDQTLNGFSPPTKPAPPPIVPPPPPPSTRLHADHDHVKIAIIKPTPPSSTLPVPPSKLPAGTPSPKKLTKYTPRRPPHGLRSSDDDLKQYGHAFKGCASLPAYIVATKVGEGTFGEVHKATHKETGQVVALKRILMHNEKEGMPITALREIRILKKLNHPNVVRLREVVIEILSGKDKEKEAAKLFGAARAFHMVFPYMDHDLAGLLENERVQMTTSQIKLYMKQLLEGTAYLHANNIIHRDMKAANILISNDGLLQIADFGLARPFDPNIVVQGRRNGEGSSPRYTNCVVTRWYRPPELFLGARRYGGEIDIWGIGCVLGEMFTRRPLLMGSSDSHQLELIWELCGTPSGNNWPGYDDLPGLDGVKRWKMRNRVVKDRYQPMGAETVDLLDKLLTLDPARRITASAALDHDWFWTDPMPANPKSLPKYESSHEIDKRNNKKNHQPPAAAPMPLHVPQAVGAVSNTQAQGPRALPPPMSNPTYKMSNRHGHGSQQQQQHPPPPGGAPGFPPFNAPPPPPPGAHPAYPYPPPQVPQFGYQPPGPGTGPPGWQPTGPPPPGWQPTGPPPPGWGHVPVYPPPGHFSHLPHIHPHPHPPHVHQQYHGHRYRGGGGGGRDRSRDEGDRGRDDGHRKSTLGPLPGTNGLPPKPVGSLVPTPLKKGGRTDGGRDSGGGGGGALPYD